MTPQYARMVASSGITESVGGDPATFRSDSLDTRSVCRIRCAARGTGRIRDRNGAYLAPRGLLHLNDRASILKVNQSPCAGRRCCIRVLPGRILRCVLTSLVVGEDQVGECPMAVAEAGVVNSMHRGTRPARRRAAGRKRFERGAFRRGRCSAVARRRSATRNHSAGSSTLGECCGAGPSSRSRLSWYFLDIAAGRASASVDRSGCSARGPRFERAGVANGFHDLALVESREPGISPAWCCWFPEPSTTWTVARTRRNLTGIRTGSTHRSPAYTDSGRAIRWAG